MVWADSPVDLLSARSSSWAVLAAMNADTAAWEGGAMGHQVWKVMPNGSLVAVWKNDNGVFVNLETCVRSMCACVEVIKTLNTTAFVFEDV